MSLPFWVFLIVWLCGLALTFVPVVPATAIVFAGGALAALLDGFQWTQDGFFLLVFAVLTTVALIADNAAAAWGARKYGASRPAIWAALAGGLLGGLLFPPFGLFLGPAVGAFLAETLLARRSVPEALSSTWGTLVGLLTGVAAKVGLHLLMGAIGLWHFWPR